MYCKFCHSNIIITEHYYKKVAKFFCSSCSKNTYFDNYSYIYKSMIKDSAILGIRDLNI